MRTDGNPKLIEVRPGFEVAAYRWPAALRVAGIFLVSGACWAAVIALVVLIGALRHG